MYMWRRILMTNDEKIDGLDAIIEDLIEWELTDMGIEELTSYYFNSKKEQYNENPEDLEDMLEYRKQYEDTEVVLYWDTDKKDVQPITTRKPSWVERKTNKVDPE